MGYIAVHLTSYSQYYFCRTTHLFVRLDRLPNESPPARTDPFINSCTVFYNYFLCDISKVVFKYIFILLFVLLIILNLFNIIIIIITLVLVTQQI